MTRIYPSLTDRFLEKLLIPDNPDDCWTWLGAHNSAGYGQLRQTKGGMVQAHRVSYEVYRGPISDGMDILHACDNPGCVNPYHLFEGTVSDNMQDASEKGRRYPMNWLENGPGGKFRRRVQ